MIQVKIKTLTCPVNTAHCLPQPFAPQVLDWNMDVLDGGVLDSC